MLPSSTVSSKGQVTIPQTIRENLGLRSGDRVEFIAEGGRTFIRPARGEDNPFDRYAGILGTFPGGVGEINAWLRKMRDGE